MIGWVLPQVCQAGLPSRALCNPALASGVSGEDTYETALRPAGWLLSPAGWLYSCSLQYEMFSLNMAGGDLLEDPGIED